MNTHARTRVKICGVRDAQTALAAIDAGADALGFVFHHASPRFIEPADAWEIIRTLPPFVTTVGLTVDLSVDHFRRIETACPTDYTQLHGAESPTIVAECGPRIIKGVRFDPATIKDQLAIWSGVDEVDAILVDGSAGGEGEPLDWDALGEFSPNITKPLMLAGGLTPQNVGDAIGAVRPYAVDVSSGVERERGVKDATLIRDFCDAVRRADAG